ncbi:cellulose biosynthesis cyclic di-GMP-binding regulatory protein BcsB [Thiolapillus sp.]
MKTGLPPSLFTLLLCLGSMQLISGAAAADTGQQPPLTSQQTLPTTQRSYTFEELGASHPLALSGSGGSMVLSFGVHGDELVTTARARITYSYSPALLPHLSHIKVLLNEEVLAILPLPQEEAGQPVTREIALDPRFLSDFNRLRFEMVAHYQAGCEDPFHSSLWARISNQSKLLLEVQPVKQVLSLADFPEPFFDPRNLQRLSLSFTFANGVEHETLAAAAELASWFGIQAAWRGTRFDALIDQLPERYGVVFATNEKRPAFLKQQPPATGPTLTLIEHPNNSWGKLLLVTGRNEADLRTAVHGLVLGEATLSGTTVKIHNSVLLKERKPYDAPSWIRLDRPVKLGELMGNRQELQVAGRRPGAININFRIPDDLFTWHRTGGIPLTLKYRYSPPLKEDESRLTVKLNEQFLTAFNLADSGQGGRKEGVAVPLFGELLSNTNEVLLPSFGMRHRNQLQFQFSFGHHQDNSCNSYNLDNVQAAIDDDSHIDLRGFPHYTALPNLRFFANSGYPFTRLADQSETVAVIAPAPRAEEISTLLTLAGRLGESTGYPATRLQVVPPSAMEKLQDREVLIIGSRAARPLMEQWEVNPASRLGELGTISTPALTVNPRYEWFGFGTDPDASPVAQVTTNANGPLAAVVAFESPVTASRSVVALMSNTPGSLLSLLDALEDPDAVSAMHGSAVFVRNGRVTSSGSTLVGQTYFVGDLSLWSRIRFFFSRHPLLLIFLTAGATLILAVVLWRSLKSIARRRMEVGEESS